MSKKEQLCQAADSQSIFVCSITVTRSEQSGYRVQPGDVLSLRDSVERGSVHFSSLFLAAVEPGSQLKMKAAALFSIFSLTKTSERVGSSF